MCVAGLGNVIPHVCCRAGECDAPCVLRGWECDAPFRFCVTWKCNAMCVFCAACDCDDYCASPVIDEYGAVMCVA